MANCIDRDVNFDTLLDFDLTHDVLNHMENIFRECRLHKISQRHGANKAVYAVAKRFGYRSDSPDLFLDGPGRQAGVNMKTQSGYAFQVPTTGRYSLYWDLVLLGKHTKKALDSGNTLGAGTADPNIVTVDVRGRVVTVDMHLSGPAFLNLLVDQRKTALARTINAQLVAKWGASGAKLETYSAPKNSNNGDGYRYLRLMGGVTKQMTEGFGWVTGWLSPDQR
jgi:hypothetical protein